MTEIRVSVQINPLQYLEGDDPWTALPGLAHTHESILRFLCAPQLSVELEDLLARYRDISQEKKRLSIAPAEPQILEKLIWPLRQAKGAYVLGNYLGTIALSGMVAEMVAMLCFEISEIILNGAPIDEAAQKNLYGSTFEKLSQHRRVEVLSGYGVLKEPSIQDFGRIRTIRKRYLHLWSHKHSAIEKDAKAAYLSAVSLVAAVIGQKVVGGKPSFNPALLRHLARLGVLEEAENDEEADEAG